MKLTENPTAAHNLLERYRQWNQGKRAPGLHVSDLVYCSRKAWTRLHYPHLKPAESDDDTLVFLLGAGHHILLQNEQDETRTVMMLGEPVHASIDGVEFEWREQGWSDDEIVVPVEFKTTRKSAGKPILESANYLDQLGAYCFSQGVNRGRLYVIYICGDWKPPKPSIACWDVAFADDELYRYKLELERRVSNITNPSTLPPLEDHYSWECERCPIKAAIDCPGGRGNFDGGFFRSLETPWSKQRA